jgi:uncharacterized Zn ribbon protein
MGDITFYCNHCSHQLIVDAKGIGLKVPCPECGKAVQIPPSSSAAPSQPENKHSAPASGLPMFEFQCPSCAKGVKVSESQIKTVMPCPFCCAKVRVPSSPSMLFRVSTESCDPAGAVMTQPGDDLVTPSRGSEDASDVPIAKLAGDGSQTPQAAKSPHEEGLIRGLSGESPTGEEPNQPEKATEQRHPHFWKRFVSGAAAFLLLVALLYAALLSYQHFAVKPHFESRKSEGDLREAKAKRVTKFERTAIEKKNIAEAKRTAELEESRRRQTEADEQRQRVEEQAKAAEEQKKAVEERTMAETIDKENTLLNTAEQNAVTLVKQLKFKEAQETLRVTTDHLKTKQGLEKAELLQDRIKRIEEFHTFLSKNVKDFKLAKGGIIDASDLSTLTISGKNVQWVDVYTDHKDILDDMINGRVFDEKSLNRLSGQEKNRLLVNVATCLSLFYPDSPDLISQTKQKLYKVFKTSQEDADTIKRLLPEFHNEYSSGRFKPICERCKTLVCPFCNGTKQCASCKGRGGLICGTCKGQGSVANIMLEACTQCGGTGWYQNRPGEMRRFCALCKKTGRVRQNIPSICPTCDGKRQVTCTTCQGNLLCAPCKGTGTKKILCPDCRAR